MTHTTITGIIDSPFDMDYYKFTLDSPVIMRISVDVGDYQYYVADVDQNARMFKISQKEDLFRLEAGTHYFVVQSSDYTYDVDKTYSITLDKIANIANDPVATLFMVNEPTKIVFQCDPGGEHMYVNGNSIDISYYYARDYSTSAGYRQYSISMVNANTLHAVIYETHMKALNDYIGETKLPTHGHATPVGNAQMQLPGVVYYKSGSAGNGDKNLNALQLSLVSDKEQDDYFYRFNCYCTGAFIDEYLCTDLNWATVFINPDTGKVIDIYYFNYLYDLIGGSGNRLSFLSKDMASCRYLYPYFNKDEPDVW